MYNFTWFHHTMYYCFYIFDCTEVLCPGCTIPQWLFKIIFWLGYCNSLMNPVIYACSSREFKRAFLRILRCQFRRGRRPPPSSFLFALQTAQATSASIATSFVQRRRSNQAIPTTRTPLEMGSPTGSRSPTGMVPSLARVGDSASAYVAGTGRTAAVNSNRLSLTDCRKVESNAILSARILSLDVSSGRIRSQYRHPQRHLANNCCLVDYDCPAGNDIGGMVLRVIKPYPEEEEEGETGGEANSDGCAAISEDGSVMNEQSEDDRDDRSSRWSRSSWSRLIMRW